MIIQHLDSILANVIVQATDLRLGADQRRELSLAFKLQCGVASSNVLLVCGNEYQLMN